MINTTLIIIAITLIIVPITTLMVLSAQLYIKILQKYTKKSEDNEIIAFISSRLKIFYLALLGLILSYGFRTLTMWRTDTISLSNFLIMIIVSIIFSILTSVIFIFSNRDDKVSVSRSLALLIISSLVVVVSGTFLLKI